MPEQTWENLSWYENIHSAIEEAQATKKLIFIYFSSDCCQGSLDQQNKTFSDARTWETLNSWFVLCHIRSDYDPETSMKYKVRYTPAFVIAGATGQILIKETGFLAPEEFREKVLSTLDSIPFVLSYEETATSGKTIPTQEAKDELKNYLPADPEVLNSLAWTWAVEAKQFHHSALVAAEKAVSIDPSNCSYIDTLATVQLSLSDFDQAIANFRNLTQIQIDGEVIESMPALKLAWALVARGKPSDNEEAIGLLKDYFLREMMPAKAK